MFDDSLPIPETTKAAVLHLFRSRGASGYGGEAVTQLQHALQAAMFAERLGAAASLIVASLLHDVGHLLHCLPDDAPQHGIDDEHEMRGGSWLVRRFGPEVVEPVRLHVAAKRYLCTTDPGYQQQLSPPSLLSLQLQGGPMSEVEAADFAAGPYFEDAVALRRFDDAAKIVGLETPSLEHFAEYIDQLAAPTQGVEES